MLKIPAFQDYCIPSVHFPCHVQAVTVCGNLFGWFKYERHTRKNMATRADEATIKGSSRHESRVCVETVKFESAISFALRCLDSSDHVLKPQ